MQASVPLLHTCPTAQLVLTQPRFLSLNRVPYGQLFVFAAFLPPSLNSRISSTAKTGGMVKASPSSSTPAPNGAFCAIVCAMPQHATTKRPRA